MYSAAGVGHEAAGLRAVRWLVEHGFDPSAPGCEFDVLILDMRLRFVNGFTKRFRGNVSRNRRCPRRCPVMPLEGMWVEADCSVPAGTGPGIRWSFGLVPG